MKKEAKFGLRLLTKKAITIIAASIASLTSHSSKATPNHIDANNDFKPDLSPKYKKKPKLVLKLNTKNINESVLVNHASHSSHASHASHASYSPPAGHASHSSHSSHASSSPSYSPSYRKIVTPPVSEPLNTAPQPRPIIKQDISINKTEGKEKPNIRNIDSLGLRTLYKGCVGIDVAALQDILQKLGFTISLIEKTSGYFGDYTDIAVRSFQLQNGLKVDGIVGKNTIIILKRKLYEN